LRTGVFPSFLWETIIRFCSDRPSLWLGSGRSPQGHISSSIYVAGYARQTALGVRGLARIPPDANRILQHQLHHDTIAICISQNTDAMSSFGYVLTYSRSVLVQKPT
jgi:hypothetical protein